MMSLLKPSCWNSLTNRYTSMIFSIGFLLIQNLCTNNLSADSSSFPIRWTYELVQLWENWWEDLSTPKEIQFDSKEINTLMWKNIADKKYEQAFYLYSIKITWYTKRYLINQYQDLYNLIWKDSEWLLNTIIEYYWETTPQNYDSEEKQQILLASIQYLRCNNPIYAKKILKWNGPIFNKDLSTKANTLFYKIWSDTDNTDKITCQEIKHMIENKENLNVWSNQIQSDIILQQLIIIQNAFKYILQWINEFADSIKKIWLWENFNEAINNIYKLRQNELKDQCDISIKNSDKSQIEKICKILWKPIPFLPSDEKLKEAFKYIDIDKIWESFRVMKKYIGKIPEQLNKMISSLENEINIIENKRKKEKNKWELEKLWLRKQSLTARIQRLKEIIFDDKTIKQISEIEQTFRKRYQTWELAIEYWPQIDWEFKQLIDYWNWEWVKANSLIINKTEPAIKEGTDKYWDGSNIKGWLQWIKTITDNRNSALSWNPPVTDKKDWNWLWTTSESDKRRDADSIKENEAPLEEAPKIEKKTLSPELQIDQKIYKDILASFNDYMQPIWKTNFIWRFWIDWDWYIRVQSEYIKLKDIVRFSKNDKFRIYSALIFYYCLKDYHTAYNIIVWTDHTLKWRNLSTDLFDIYGNIYQDRISNPKTNKLAQKTWADIIWFYNNNQDIDWLLKHNFLIHWFETDKLDIARTTFEGLNWFNELEKIRIYWALLFHYWLKRPDIARKLLDWSNEILKWTNISYLVPDYYKSIKIDNLPPIELNKLSKDESWLLNYISMKYIMYISRDQVRKNRYSFRNYSMEMFINDLNKHIDMFTWILDWQQREHMELTNSTGFFDQIIWSQDEIIRSNHGHIIGDLWIREIKERGWWYMKKRFQEYIGNDIE